MDAQMAALEKMMAAESQAPRPDIRHGFGAGAPAPKQPTAAPAKTLPVAPPLTLQMHLQGYGETAKPQAWHWWEG